MAVNTYKLVRVIIAGVVEADGDYKGTFRDIENVMNLSLSIKVVGVLKGRAAHGGRELQDWLCPTLVRRP